MEWLPHPQSVGTLLASSARLALTAGYYVTIPLHYPLYYALALLAFLLSPLWYMLRLGLACVVLGVDLVARLKYLYIYLASAALIGFIAGLVLHGTSSYIYVLLGVDRASAAAAAAEQKRRARLLIAEKDDHRHIRAPYGANDDDYSDYYYSKEEADSQSYSPGSAKGSGGGGGGGGGRFFAPSTTTTSNSSASRRSLSTNANELFENQWRLLRPVGGGPRRNGTGTGSGGGGSSSSNGGIVGAEKTRQGNGRRSTRNKGGSNGRRSLLAQTIHEESSESDSM
ncbi:hypothetical protein F4778DRAFT_712763 [Xylariomycetidae sp. FL2044]|nr:hypothetical protein F4778DRAFT_712763 [Xylariomycetidae sp. FL2044]